MSYILEALKKAQAERQLGSAPDIHAPAPVHAPAPSRAASRMPLLVGLSAGIVIAGVAGALAWRAKSPAPAAVQASQAQAPAPTLAQATPPDPIAAAPAPAPTPAPNPAAAAAAEARPARTVVAAASPAPAAPSVSAPLPAAVPAPAAPLPPAAAPARSRTPAQPEPTALAARNSAAPAAAARDAVPEAVYLPAPGRAPDPAPVARAPEPAEENLRSFQQLPEALQREIPRVSVGGYIYSPNPADRLLLIDKTLRREGEEVAPGLVLERLLPKYAVMNYRGNRYRVGY